MGDEQDGSEMNANVRQVSGRIRITFRASLRDKARRRGGAGRSRRTRTISADWIATTGALSPPPWPVENPIARGEEGNIVLSA